MALLTPEEGPLPQRDLFPDDEWTAKLAVAPGTVYGNRWEQMRTNAQPVRVVPVPYEPPFASADDNPRCFLDIRSGGVSLGRVVVELRPDVAPLACRNFEQLCAYGVYKGAIFHRVFADFIIQGGDYNLRCELVCDSADACFDLAQVEYTPGGRSIYSDRADGTFVDECSDSLRHARGTLSMSNRGRPDTNGSQFFFCITPPDAPPRHLDGKYTVFGQVLEGFSILAALSSVARKDGTTLQRVVCEDCGVAPAARRAAVVPAASARRATIRCAARPHRIRASSTVATKAFRAHRASAWL